MSRERSAGIEISQPSSPIKMLQVYENVHSNIGVTTNRTTNSTSPMTIIISDFLAVSCHYRHMT